MSDAPPIITESASAKPTRRVPWLLLFVTFSIVGVICLLYVLRRNAKSHGAVLLGTVSVAVRGFETNAFTEEVTALVAVRNSGQQVLEFGHGVQIRAAQGWAHTNGNPQQFRLTAEDDSMLTPGSERLVSVVRPSFGVPWRVVAVCWEPKSQTTPKGKAVQFYSPEMSP